MGKGIELVGIELVGIELVGIELVGIKWKQEHDLRMNAISADSSPP
jgi:hypothetical protein